MQIFAFMWENTLMHDLDNEQKKLMESNSRHEVLPSFMKENLEISYSSSSEIYPFLR